MVCVVVTPAAVLLTEVTAIFGGFGATFGSSALGSGGVILTSDVDVYYVSFASSTFFSSTFFSSCFKGDVALLPSVSYSTFFVLSGVAPIIVFAGHKSLILHDTHWGKSALH